MNASLCPGYPHLVPYPPDVAAIANAAEADAMNNRRPKLVALAFDPNGHYAYTVLSHPANLTPTPRAA